MHELLVQLNGKTVRLADCSWLQRRPCGCVTAVMTAVTGDDVYATAEQAAAHLSPAAWQRAEDERLGLTIELITLADYRTTIGPRWLCGTHAAAVTA